MTTRTTSTTVTFKRPFLIGGFDAVQQAGTYTVDTEEEQITGVSFPAWKRTGTIMQVQEQGATEHVQIDAKELHEALMRDGAQPDAANPLSPPSPKKRRDSARLVSRKKF